ncbi:MAG: SAM-dependent methyltransferase [Rhizobiales bacterium NRL2]|jgi:sarcosine/dimethylglycine N-methyltransferase|nr:MAG: SAM-dependent methyltransferase [Rhizobiales bacterium NRL2]
MQQLQDLQNPELLATAQDYSDDETTDRDSGLYRAEYVMSFVEKWDELIDWDARARSEGKFFIQMLQALGANRVLDVACGTGFHSVQLMQAGFDVTSADGSAAMVAKAFENGKKHGLILKTVQADWRWLTRDIVGTYDAVVCLGNSFTHLHDEADRRRALAEFYSVLGPDGVLILDQRNYDSILDDGFSTQHKYYYCGEQVTAEPEYVDEGLTRFRYTFPDESVYHLNMFPLRKNYTRRLIGEAGFQAIKTYGDFKETYQESDPDFFIHVANKAHAGVEEISPRKAAYDKTTAVAEDYYDSSDADEFYFNVWGGEDIHVGIYDNSPDIREASRITVETMAETVGEIRPETRIIDLGAGYGGAARYLARTFDCSVTCVNISRVQNIRNERLTAAQDLDDRVSVVHGAFESVPEPDASFDVVWSQDAFLHSGEREKVLAEAFRLLRPGGSLVFTDPMQADEVDDPEALRPVYERIHLESLGSFAFYREAAKKAGFEEVQMRDFTPQIANHYGRVAEVLTQNYDRMQKKSSKEYLDRMLVGLDNWVKAGDAGLLAWGVLHFRKPR